MNLTHASPIPRRTFLACALAAGCTVARSFAESASPARSGATRLPINAFSRLKKKLADGQSATLLLISDSTGYRDISGTRRFIRWLASQYPAHHTTESYWAEWVTNAPTGPRNYGEQPIVLAEGTTKATLTVLNAVLPGAVAQAMTDGSRWANMIAPLNGQAPDLVLWNHGHNHQANIAPKSAAYGRGSFFAPLGRLALEYPDTPQAAIVQNPWRDNDGYERVRDWWLSVAETQPSLTLVDGYSPFLERKKSAELYQDNVHPSAQGYELIYRQLQSAWEATTAQETVPTTSWANVPADQPLVANGDLRDWTADLPANWRLIHGAVVRKDHEHTFRQAPWSLALTGVTQNDGLQISLSGAALARVRGRTVSFALLCYVPHEAEQDIQVKFTTSSSDQVTGSIQCARDNWKWIVMAGCLVPPDATLAFVGIYRSFAKPPNDVPFYVQKLVIVEGDSPKGVSA